MEELRSGVLPNFQAVAEVATEGSALPDLCLVLKFEVCLPVLAGLEFCLHLSKPVQHCPRVPSEAVKVPWPRLCLHRLERQL